MARKFITTRITDKKRLVVMDSKKNSTTNLKGKQRIAFNAFGFIRCLLFKFVVLLHKDIL